MEYQNEYLGYRGNKRVNIDYHHGQLPPVVGVQSYQVFRARLMTQQWGEECDRDDDIITIKGDYRAFCYYHIADGRTVGLWKWSKAIIGDAQGQEWSNVFDVNSLIMAGAKVWGQKTSDGKYALLYNPTTDNNHRWPLAIVTSEDGLNFDDLHVVGGEVPPRRYLGQYKDAGLNYIRGIEEGNENPSDGSMWVTYSMNKEDIWVTRIAVPIKLQETQAVKDDMSDVDAYGFLKDWNIYSPLWAPVSVENFPSSENKSLMLKDKDLYDYAKAEGVLPKRTKITVETRIRAEQSQYGHLFIELQDEQGARSNEISNGIYIINVENERIVSSKGSSTA